MKRESPATIPLACISQGAGSLNTASVTSRSKDGMRNENEDEIILGHFYAELASEHEQIMLPLILISTYEHTRTGSCRIGAETGDEGAAVT